MDRNRIEQDALAALQKGNNEAALACYQQILRAEPRDRRIRQKAAELLIKLQRPAEAESHLREVGDSFLREGQHRSALAILKQVLAMAPEDPQLHMDVAECSHAVGSPPEARTHWDTALRLWLGQARPADALRAARRLADQAPQELSLKLRVAELLEAAGDSAGAAQAFVDLAEAYRKRGRADEVGRVAEMALRLRPDDLELLRGAARARLEDDDARGALVHLQTAFQKGPQDPETLGLLARAFEGAGQPDKARRVLLELSRVSAEARGYAQEVEALQKALALGHDPALEPRLAAAEERLARSRRRLTDLAFAAPRDEAELRAVVRAEVYARYGFHDRAEAALVEALGGAPDAACLEAARAETLKLAGRDADALALARSLLAKAGSEANAVHQRIAVWTGASLDAIAAPAPVAAAPSVPVPSAQPAQPTRPASSEEVDGDAGVEDLGTSTPAVESALSRGDRLAEEGDIPGALFAYRAALSEDPRNEDVLRRIGDLRARASAGSSPAFAAAPVPVPVLVAVPAPAPVRPAPTFSLEEGGTFAEIVPDELDEVEASALDDLLGDPVEEARELVAVGAWVDALALLEGVEGLEAAVVRAEAQRGAGEAPRALEALKEAIAESPDTDVAYAPALFELATLQTLTQKHRLAVRTLEELRVLAPEHRPAEVEARLRGLARLIK